VSELFTVGQGAGRAFPATSTTPTAFRDETRHDECYNFRFKPDYGSGLQMLQREDNEPGDAYHIVDGSTV
jgi:5-deoxy-glucuronate isomerase